ncbi:hypothetical protein PsYK624_034450 [Phanerochaete sordida]|uniref:Uncharacterized protein n=1 Tax=Phanerochaete sordida TaxID=48140 RepID=A0A9P3G3D6_9APHY|nr:hypothetical protein PsYK624_034450 [Phanerochaete sordida]
MAASSSNDGSETSDDNPIRDQMEDVLLDAKLDWNCAFSFYRAHSDAPNPLLNIDHVGTVGLPVAARDVQALRDQELAESDTNSAERGPVWQVDVKKVKAAASKWHKFVEKAAQDVLDSLSLETKNKKPRVELKRLLVFEEGSDLIPNNDSEETGRAFATMLIFLPSQHTGGAIHLSKHGLSFKFDPSANCLEQTSVLAWRPGTTLTQRGNSRFSCAKIKGKPLTSGHRLALSYTISSATKPARASAADTTALTQLTNVLDAWNKARAAALDTPRKLVCLLAGSYAAPLALSTLRGADAHRAAALAGLAPAHGFAVGLATLCASASGGRDRYGEDLDFTYRLRDLVDALSGALLAPGVGFDVYTESVPDELDEEMERRGCDSEDVDDDDEECIMVERSYTQTVLVVWPYAHHFDVVYGGKGGVKRACNAFSRASESSPDGRTLVDALLAQEDDETKMKARACCDAALRWKDAKLWCRAVETYAKQLGLGVVPHEATFAAAQEFGFSEIKLGLERMLRAEGRPGAQAQFLDAVEEWSRILSSAQKRDVGRGVQPWVKAQRRNIHDAESPSGPTRNKGVKRASDNPAHASAKKMKVSR